MDFVLTNSEIFNINIRNTMKMKKLIRIHSLKKEDELKLDKEYSKFSKENNMLYEQYRIWDLFFDIDWKLKTMSWEKEIDMNWIFYISSFDSSLFGTSILYYLFHLNNAKTLVPFNRYNFKQNKITQFLFCKHCNFPTPKQIAFKIDIRKEFDSYREFIEKKIWYPCIIKLPDVDRWEWVFKANNKEELKEIFEALKESQTNFKNLSLIVSEFIENSWDYRIISSKNKVLWVIKRYNPNGYKNNIAQGWTSRIAYLPKKILDKVPTLVREYGLGIVWLDIFFENGKWYVIEINSFPQTHWFEETTWLNFTEFLFNEIKEL